MAKKNPYHSQTNFMQSNFDPKFPFKQIIVSG